MQLQVISFHVRPWQQLTDVKDGSHDWTFMKYKLLINHLVCVQTVNRVRHTYTTTKRTHIHSNQMTVPFLYAIYYIISCRFIYSLMVNVLDTKANLAYSHLYVWNNKYLIEQVPIVDVLWLMKHIEKFIKDFMIIRVYSNFTVAFYKSVVVHNKHCEVIKESLAAIIGIFIYF